MWCSRPNPRARRGERPDVRNRPAGCQSDGGSSEPRGENKRPHQITLDRRVGSVDQTPPPAGRAGRPRPRRLIISDILSTITSDPHPHPRPRPLEQDRSVPDRDQARRLERGHRPAQSHDRGPSASGRPEGRALQACSGSDHDRRRPAPLAGRPLLRRHIVKSASGTRSGRASLLGAGSGSQVDLFSRLEIRTSGATVPHRLGLGRRARSHINLALLDQRTPTPDRI